MVWPSKTRQFQLGGAYTRDLAVVEVHDVARVADDGLRIAGDDALVVAEADDERRTELRHDQPVGVFVEKHDDAEGAMDLVKRAQHGLDRVARVRAPDQVGEQFRVGLGTQAHTFAQQVGAQVVGVVDDAVVHDGEAPPLVGVGMGVGLGDAAVGGPTGVGETDPGVRRGSRQFRFEGGNTSHGLANPQRIVRRVDQGEAPPSRSPGIQADADRRSTRAGPVCFR